MLSAKLTRKPLDRFSYDIWMCSNSPQSASLSKSTRISKSLSAKKSSRNAKPNSTNSRIFHRQQNLAISLIGIIKLDLFIVLSLMLRPRRPNYYLYELNPHKSGIIQTSLLLPLSDSLI